MRWEVVRVRGLAGVSCLHLFGEKLHAQGASTENITEGRRKLAVRGFAWESRNKFGSKSEMN